MQNVAGYDDVPPFFGKPAKQRDGFGAHQRIQAVERFVQHQHQRVSAHIACASLMRCRMPLL